MTRVVTYDTTLRDGTQGEGVSLSLQDKLDVARRLDALGIDYIEAGYPASNPKDEEVFRQLASEPLAHARPVAFGMTRRVGVRAEDDPALAGVLAAETEAVALVGKASGFHVRKVLRTDLDENLAMVRDSVSLLKEAGRTVFFDAEHYFDGYKASADYARQVVSAALEAGADWLILCETNGGCLPEEVAEIVEAAAREVGGALGIHCHNDAGLAVANSLAAVRAGCTQVQGTINGLGERCGNADLCVLIPDLELKMGRECLGAERLAHLTDVSRFVYDVANLFMVTGQPYVGPGAFAHKGGMHVSAVAREEQSYEHVDPSRVGNTRRLLV
ncbi:MAG: citramalate synthase, partial [Planctomycetota bacterium]|nr:citramalate synthase [Planctomycetota bacterium]